MIPRHRFIDCFRDISRLHRDAFSSLWKPGEIPAMDGLRALAILLVVVMHIFQTMPRFSFVAYGIEWAMPLYNGWTGVDLFFVISGYLIGGGILKSLKNGQFSLKKFYVKRALRIIPPYFAVILVLCLLRMLWPTLADTIVGPFGLSEVVTNMAFITDYKPANLAIASWSLSIEEHFYLLIPILLLAMRQAEGNAIVRLLVTLMVASLGFRAFAYHRFYLGPESHLLDVLNRVYFPFHARMDGLSMGVLVAVIQQHAPEPGPLARSAMRQLGMLLFLIILLGGALRGGWFEVTIQFTLLALGFGAMVWGALDTSPERRKSLLIRALSSKLLTPVARLSYSLFLTHIAVLQFFEKGVEIGQWSRWVLFPWMLVTCVIVSLPLYFWVEHPVHRLAQVKNRKAH